MEDLNLQNEDEFKQYHSKNFDQMVNRNQEVIKQ